jgi:hypothetical protein
MTEQEGLYKKYHAHMKPNGPHPPGKFSVRSIPPEPPPAFLRCPSDSWDPNTFPTTNYAGNLGPQCTSSMCGNAPFDYLCNTLPGIPASAFDGNTTSTVQVRGVFNRYGAPMSLLLDVPDGTSTTLMAGEILPTTIKQAKNGWYSYNGGASHAATLVPINYPQVNVPCKQPYSAHNSHFNWGYRSRHVGGAQFVLCDGSVHFLNEDIDPAVFQYLGCRNDQQAVNLP